MSTCTVVLRIPLPQFDVPIYPPPSLQKTLKSNPFETRKQVKSHWRHRFHSYQPRNLIYPEISTLSATDIANDLDYLYQNRRVSSSFVTPFGGTPLLWGPNSSLRPGMVRTVCTLFEPKASVYCLLYPWLIQSWVLRYQVP